MKPGPQVDITAPSLAKLMNTTVQVSPPIGGGAAGILGCPQIDITAPNEVLVEVMRSPAGHDVFYVTIDGLTILRACRFTQIVYRDSRPKQKP